MNKKSKIVIETTFLGDLEYPNWQSVVVDFIFLVALLIGAIWLMGKLP